MESLLSPGTVRIRVLAVALSPVDRLGLDDIAALAADDAALAADRRHGQHLHEVHEVHEFHDADDADTLLSILRDPAAGAASRGFELAGIVEAVGAGCDGPERGERGRIVVGSEVVCLCALDSPFGGGLGGVTVQSMHGCFLKPDACSFEAAAAALGPGLHAMATLYQKARLRRDDVSFAHTESE
jgi:NADPH:quinone reductase-like Zn-dependent oxidoreductase